MQHSLFRFADELQRLGLGADFVISLQGSCVGVELAGVALIIEVGGHASDDEDGGRGVERE
ncbi:hypothetical protein FRC12_003060 [Ceratobasidium sp. 428]|nr:hypothetical protein FRC12_003060 [Ceratobasidium sp. 428]